MIDNQFLFYSDNQFLSQTVSSVNSFDDLQICHSSCHSNDNNGTSLDSDGLDIVPYDEKQKVLDHTDEILKVFQNLDIDLRTKKNNNILIVQNVNIQNNENIDCGNDIYELIFQEISRIGGLKNFLIELYKKASFFCKGNRTKTANKLGVSVRTVRNYLNESNGQ